MILTTLLKTKGNLPVFPTKEHRHLKSGHLQIILPSPVREHQTSTRQEISRGDELVGESDGAIGHVVMPLQLPATMLRLVELLHLHVEDVNSWTKCSNVSMAQQYDCRSHLRNKVFKLSWQSDWDSFTGSSPGSHVEDFYWHLQRGFQTPHFDNRRNIAIGNLAAPATLPPFIKSSSPSPLFSCPGPSVGLWTGCSGLRWLWCLGTFATTCLWSLQASQPVLRWKAHWEFHSVFNQFWLIH